MALVTYKGSRTQTSARGFDFDLNLATEVPGDHPALKMFLTNPYFEVEEDTLPLDEERETLMAEAEALGVEYRKNIRTDTLRERVEEAKASGDGQQN